MKVQRKCKNCGDSFMAKSADVKRGWAKFCSKSCKAREQTRRTGYSGPREDSYLSLGSGDYEDKADFNSNFFTGSPKGDQP